MPKIPYLGEGLSLLAAVLWAFAVIMFKKSGEKIHPLALNLFKNLLAFALFIPTILIFEGRLLRHVPLSDSAVLIASGALGIGIGDSLYLHSLNLIGAGLSAIVVCLYSPLIILLSVVVLGESLSLIQLGGAGLIVLAIFVATYERERSAPAKNLAAGIVFGILANVANAVSIVMAKRVLERSPLFWTAEVRLLAGIVVLVLILAVLPGRRKIVAPLIVAERWPVMIVGSLTGAYIAMMVWLAGMKFAPASVASALNQTSTIFIFIFAAFILREPVTRKRVAGIVLAFIGVFLVSFG